MCVCVSLLHYFVYVYVLLSITCILYTYTYYMYMYYQSICRASRMRMIGWAQLRSSGQRRSSGRWIHGWRGRLYFGFLNHAAPQTWVFDKSIAVGTSACAAICNCSPSISSRTSRARTYWTYGSALGEGHRSAGRMILGSVMLLTVMACSWISNSAVAS